MRREVVVALLPEFSLVPFPEQLGPYWYTSSAVEATVMRGLVLRIGTGNVLSVSDARPSMSASRTSMAANLLFGRVLAASRRIRDIRVWARSNLAAVCSNKVLN